MNGTEIVPFEVDCLTGKLLKDHFCGGKFRGKPVQSVCYVTWMDRYFVGFSHNADAGKGTIIRARNLSFRDDAVEAIAEGLPVGHCNDMEYNPTDRRIYIARGDKQIAVFNQETMTVERTIPVDCYAWAIARYPSGFWYIHDGHGGRMYDEAFRLLVCCETDETEKMAAALGVPYDPVKQCYRAYWQGAVMIGKRPYMIYTEWSDTPDVFKSCCLVTFRSGIPEIYRYETKWEFESACMVNGLLQFVYGNIWIGSANWDMSEIRSKLIYPEIKKIDFIAGENTKIDLSEFVPQGYELAAVAVSFRRGKLWRSLPYMDNSGEGVVWVLKVEDNIVYVHANTTYKESAVRIVGTCRSKEM